MYPEGYFVRGNKTEVGGTVHFRCPKGFRYEEEIRKGFCTCCGAPVETWSQFRQDGKPIPGSVLFKDLPPWSADPGSEEKGGGEVILIDLKELYGETAKLAELPAYEAEALRQAGEGNEVVLTGAGPVWLYLRLAHKLHGKVRKLLYRSPATGDVVVFDHDPF